MSVNCDPNALMEASKCFKCIPTGMQPEVMTYLLNQLLTNPLTPEQLVEAAKCFKCIPPGMQQEVITYLLCQIAQGGGGGGNCQFIWGPDTTGLGDLYLDNDQNNTSFSFPNLVTVGVDIGMYMVVSLQTISMPSLTTVGGLIDFNSCPALTTVSFPMLASVGGSTFSSNNCPLLTTFTLTSLTTVAAIFDCSQDISLSSLLLPSLITVGGNFSSMFCTSLTTVDVSSWIPTDGKTIRFDGCALNASSVELILRRCVLAGVTTCTINLSGGTNAGVASLSAQGQADVVTLGAQLTINP